MRLNFDDTFNCGVNLLRYFWKSYICVEADFLPEGAPRETTEESAAHHFLIKMMSEAQKLLFGSSGNNFGKIRFSAKMTPPVGQNPRNFQLHLCWILLWTHLFKSSNIVHFANETQFRWYFQLWSQSAEIFLKIIHLRWSWFFARRGPRRNDRGECCAPFSY